ncbi:MAG: polysialic acid transporter [Rariglobus sp.]|jgi:capsular polysaccharide transport system permease protein|nr:polysialic acid transporter [Rariglobus sp.]
MNPNSTGLPRRKPPQVQWAVIHALFVRNLSAQFGQLRGGIAWAFVEPLMQVLLFTFLFYLRGRHELGNIPIPMLVITGVAPFILFRQVAHGGARAFRQADALFNYRLVQPVDPVLSNGLHHFVFFIFTLTVFTSVCHILHFRIEQVRFLELLVNIGLLLILALGLSMLFTVLLTVLPEARRFVPFFIRPLFFISGIFFTAESLPSDIRPYFLLNPLLHATEITRSCFYYSYTSHGRLDFIAVCAAASLTAGMLAMRLNHKRLLQDD